MTNIPGENPRPNLTEAIRFAIEQSMKDLYTSIPGVIVNYDSATRRARIQPAVQRELTSGEMVNLPEIANVPVVHPTAGGYSVLFPVQPGDPCLLVFSQRGITGFKTNFEVAQPDENMHDLQDAVAILGFGPISLAPASSSGVSMQSDDGTNYVAVESGQINVVTPGNVDVQAGGSITATAGGTAEITASAITINGPTTINGTLTTTGAVTAPSASVGGVDFGSHVHDQPNDSNGDSEQPTTGARSP